MPRAALHGNGRCSVRRGDHAAADIDWGARSTLTESRRAAGRVGIPGAESQPAASAAA
jgi:hypothetical protein